MKYGRFIVLSMLLAFASPAMADTVSGFNAMTATGDGGLILSVNYMGQEYTVADGTLVSGDTTKYNSVGDDVDDPDQTFRPGWNADDFDLNTAAANGGMVYMNTLFDMQSTAFFIFERGGQENATIQAIDADGNPIRSPIYFLPQIWDQVWESPGDPLQGELDQDVYGILFETDDPVWGFRITSRDIDVLSSSTAIPIPGAAWLLSSGLVGLVFLRRRMKS